MSSWRPIIGLEMHVELRTASKMFCTCSADHFGVLPNRNVCPVCLGLPGALPVANKEAIRRTLLLGAAVGSELAKHSKFDRKHYFYPDLPKGYQISQYDQPLCLGGTVPTSLGAVALERIHLEEDTAKLQHRHLSKEQLQHLELTNPEVSLVDYNRSGVALVEIVTKPVIHDPAQAREYAKNMAAIVRSLGISDGDMEKGSMRLEANISVQSEQEQTQGELPAYKVEVKNLNSFRFLERAIRFEIERHIELREQGELPKQETRGWNDPKGYTYSQRSKEVAEDYRYFPDPDLPPLEFDEEFLSEIKSAVPELPLDRAKRYGDLLGIKPDFLLSFCEDLEQVKMMEETVLPHLKSKKIDAKKAGSLLAGGKLKLTDDANAIKELLNSLLQEDQVDEAELAKVVQTVLTNPANAKLIARWRAGEEKLINVLVGQVKRQLPNSEAQNIIKLLSESK